MPAHTPPLLQPSTIRPTAGSVLRAVSPQISMHTIAAGAAGACSQGCSCSSSSPPSATPAACSVQPRCMRRPLRRCLWAARCGLTRPVLTMADGSRFQAAEIAAMQIESMLRSCLQDAMQRSTLVPLREFMEGKDASQLKVGEGTGWRCNGCSWVA